MKTILLLFAVLIIGCEKDKEPIKPAVKPTKVIGSLIITPFGNPSDSFQYSLGGSLQVDNIQLKGIVSNGPDTIDLVENSTYHITYNDTIPAWVQVVGVDTIRSYTSDKWIHTTSEPMNVSIELPATIFR